VALAKLCCCVPTYSCSTSRPIISTFASQEVLEAVLDEFPGTILLVTHDRYLVDSLASQLWILEPDEND